MAINGYHGEEFYKRALIVMMMMAGAKKFTVTEYGLEKANGKTLKMEPADAGGNVTIELF